MDFEQQRNVSMLFGAGSAGFLSRPVWSDHHSAEQAVLPVRLRAGLRDRMNELPITGYLDRLSARPGEALDAMISMREGGR